jgi:VWFA-related protein
MVLVPVIVRDREGHTVADLRQEDLQLFDKGKEQPIASFSVERSEPTASGAPPSQFIVYFFDDVSLRDFGTVMPLRAAALHQLASLQPGDRVAVFTSSCQLAIDFTGDRAKLQEVVSKLVPNPVHICRVAPDVHLQITLLEAVVKRMTHLPGARRIVVVSAGFGVNAVEKPLLEALIDEAAEAKATIDSLHITEATREQSGAPGSAADPRAFSTPSILDNRETSAPGAREANSENLFTLALGTGGTVIEAGNKPEESFRAFSTPDCVYTIGFVPAEKADGTYHKLKVTLKDSRKLNLSARAGYYATEAAGAPMTAAAALPETPHKAAEKTVMTSEVTPPSPLAPTVNALAAAAPERAAFSGPVSFRARTSLVQVPVVVRDKNGNPVGGLRKSDFQLADRGQKQDIIAFNEEKLDQPEKVEKTATQSLPNQPAAAAKAASNVVPDRFTAYLFDDIHMRRGDLAQVREALWKHLQESASPSERIAIFTTSRRIFADFTDDLDKLHTALYKINSTYRYRVPTCPQPPVPCTDVSFYLAYQVGRGNTLALSTASTLLGQPMSPLNGGGLKQPDQSTGSAGMYAETVATKDLRMGEQETSLSLDAVRDVARRMMTLGGHRTLVMLSQGMFVPYEQEAELERTIDWALRSGVVVNTLNSAGLVAPMEMGVTGAEDDTVEPSGQTTTFTNEARNAEMENLVFLAEATGGTAIARSNDYLSGIRRIASPPEYRYILGFSPHDLAPDGKFHALSIKLTNPADKGYSVQARKGYYAPNEGEGLPQGAAKEIENAVFSRDDVRDLPVEMRTEIKKSEGSGGELTVSTDIDLKLLHYRKAEGRNCQELTAVAAIFDRDGNFVAGKQQTLTLKLRDETMQNPAQKPETLQSSFALSPGSYLVRLVVRSAEEQAMTEMSSQVDVR